MKPFFRGGVAVLAGLVAVAERPVLGAERSVPQAAVRTNDPLQFSVSFPASVRSQAVSGRVLLFLVRKGGGEPRQLAASLLSPEPVFARDVTNWPPGRPLLFEPADFRAPDALAFPVALERLESGAYRAQALIDQDRTVRDFNAGPGNLYSLAASCELRGARGGKIELVADQVVRTRGTTDTEWVREVSVRSRLLSGFHGRDIYLRAGVILPAGFSNAPAIQYPAVYVIPGFGGRHTEAWGWINSSPGQRWRKGEAAFPHLRVVLDPDVPLGHSVFANSANNGPVGDALVQELIPEIERRFRGRPEAGARFVTGHSSGGWSSLWLQVTHPDFFGGCWSTAPDPVDFRAFQTVDIYSDRNGHWTREGLPRPVARNREKVLLTMEQLNHQEYVLGYGGQLDSFDGVFSPRGTDGRPRQLIDKLTGGIDRAVADHWRRYDIRRVLEENWSTLGPRLQGKLHVIAAGWDSFYLDAGVDYLREFLSTRPHGGYVEILPGDHGSVLTTAVRARIEREMAERNRALSRPKAQDSERRGSD